MEAGPEAVGGGFFRENLRARQGSDAAERRQWRLTVYEQIGASRSREGRSPRVGTQCWLAEVSRAGFYRHWQEREPKQEEVLLRDRLQQVVVGERRRRGYRYAAQLLRAEGFAVNQKRVLRLMREDNLLCLR